MIIPTTNLFLFASLESTSDVDAPEFVAINWNDQLEFRVERARDLITSEGLAAVTLHCAAEFPDEAYDDLMIDGRELVVGASALTFTCYDAAVDQADFEALLGDIAAITAAAAEARSAGQRYFVMPGETLEADAIEAFLQERDARIAADALLIDEDTFREQWGASAAPSGDLLGHADVLQLDRHHVWTVLEGERNHWIASPGFRVVSRLGYVTTTRPWDDNTPDAFWVRGD